MGSQPTFHQTVRTRLQRTHALPTLASKAILSTRLAGQFSQLAMRIGRSAVVKILSWFDLVKASSRMRAEAEIDPSDAYPNTSFDRRSVAAASTLISWSFVT